MSNMRLRTRKLLTPELTNNGSRSSEAEPNEPREHTPAGPTETNSEENMNLDSQVVRAALVDTRSHLRVAMLVAWRHVSFMGAVV